MFWYIVICILMLYPAAISTAGDLTGKRTKPLALALACLVLWFFMAMRATSVGVDTKYYSYVFTQFPRIPLREVFTAVTYATERRTWSFDFEPGYRLVNKLLSYISGSGQTITFFNSTLIMLLLYSAIQRNTKGYMMAIWLYVTLGIYQTEMNVTRNAIAILIVYNGFPSLRAKKFGKYLLYCLFASTFHAAALALIPVYWLVHHVKLTPGRCIWLVVISCGVGVIFPYLSPYIRMLTPSSLDKYFTGATESLSSILVGMFNGGVFLMVYAFMSPRERRRVFEVCTPGVVMLVINLCFFGLNIGLDDASRMAALYGPYTMFLIPNMIDLIESKNQRKNVLMLTAVVCGCVYILRMCINNIGGTMPYAFFW